ncbi:hypothetical protein ACWDOP_01630 [Nocardia sp. NPDC003693]
MSGVPEAPEDAGAQRLSRSGVMRERSAGLLAALADVGFSVDSVQQLARSREDYTAAVPVLFEWFPRVDYLPLALSIMEALEVSFAQEQAQYAFLEFFRRPPVVGNPFSPATAESMTGSLRFSIADGLGKFAGPHLSDELIELALDPSLGPHRGPIVVGLAKTMDPRVPNACYFRAS